jgi:hypothetical protein
MMEGITAFFAAGNYRTGLAIRATGLSDEHVDRWTANVTGLTTR